MVFKSKEFDITIRLRKRVDVVGLVVLVFIIPSPYLKDVEEVAHGTPLQMRKGMAHHTDLQPSMLHGMINQCLHDAVGLPGPGTTLMADVPWPVGIGQVVDGVDRGTIDRNFLQWTGHAMRSLVSHSLPLRFPAFQRTPVSSPSSSGKR